MESVNIRLKSILKSRGLTMKELAQYIGVAPETLSRFVRGKQELSNKLLTDCAFALKVPLDYLLGKTDDVPDNISENLSVSYRNEKRKKYEDIVNLIILNELKNGDVPCSIQPFSTKDLCDRFFDLIVNAEKMAYFEEWGFSYFYFEGGRTINKAQFLFEWLGRLACLSYNPRRKATAVINDESIYNSFLEKTPRSLSMFVSFMLVDVETMKLIDEQYVDTAAVEAAGTTVSDLNFSERIWFD